MSIISSLVYFAIRLTNVDWHIIQQLVSETLSSTGQFLPSMIIRNFHYLASFNASLIIIGILGTNLLLPVHTLSIHSMGILLGLVGVFHYPKLQVPSTQKVAFFLKDNPMEIYEFTL